MSEGGVLAWKVQKVRSAPTLNYNNLQKPLRAPKGQRWNYDSATREWSLEDLPRPETAEYWDDLVVDAEIVKESTSNQGVGSALFVEHLVQPTDTFEGVCLRYKVSPTELRQANEFTGSNLYMAPNPLKIPRRATAVTSANATLISEGNGVVPRALTTDQVVRILLKKCPTMSKSEATAYLELNEWGIADAIANAQEDGF